MRLEIKLKQIVGSRTRAKLIKIFFSKPNDSFFVRQLVRLTQEEINSVRRELTNLKEIGAVLSQNRSNKLFYWANSKFIFFNELALIGFKSKKFWAEISKYNNKEGGVYKVICSKSFVFSSSEEEEKTKDEVDMVIIGKIHLDKVSRIISEEEKKLGKEINYMVMTKKEFNLRIAGREPFMVDFFLKAPITIMGNYV